MYDPKPVIHIIWSKIHYSWAYMNSLCVPRCSMAATSTKFNKSPSRRCGSLWCRKCRALTWQTSTDSRTTRRRRRRKCRKMLSIRRPPWFQNRYNGLCLEWRLPCAERPNGNRHAQNRCIENENMYTVYMAYIGIVFFVFFFGHLVFPTIHTVVGSDHSTRCCTKCTHAFRPRRICYSRLFFKV